MQPKNNALKRKQKRKRKNVLHHKVLYTVLTRGRAERRASRPTAAQLLPRPEVRAAEQLVGGGVYARGGGGV